MNEHGGTRATGGEAKMLVAGSSGSGVGGLASGGSGGVGGLASGGSGGGIGAPSGGGVGGANAGSANGGSAPGNTAGDATGSAAGRGGAGLGGGGAGGNGGGRGGDQSGAGGSGHEQAGAAGIGGIAGRGGGGGMTSQGGSAGTEFGGGGTGAQSGASGVGGAGMAGNGGGVAGQAGSGGSAEPVAGAGGSATMPNPCETARLIPKAFWKASASHSAVQYNNVPQNLLDNDIHTWSTGKPQAGDEWLQIDLGLSSAVRELSLTMNPDGWDDYPRFYEVVVSDKPLDFNAAIRASGAGVYGETLVITFATPIVGRYVLIRQKGQAVYWWTANEFDAVCY